MVIKRNVGFIQTLILITYLSIVCCFEKEQTPENVRILRITGNFPDEMYLEVRTIFNSIPNKSGCKGVSLVDGSIKPLHESRKKYIRKSGETIDVPLTWIWKSKCKWEYRENQIILVDSTGLSQTEKIVIYRNKGDVRLQDSINIICDHCVNPTIEPPFYYAECWKFHNNKKMRSLFYNLHDVAEDTIDLTINIFFESDSVSICNEEFNQLRESQKDSTP